MESSNSLPPPETEELDVGSISEFDLLHSSEPTNSHNGFRPPSTPLNNALLTQAALSPHGGSQDFTLDPNDIVFTINGSHPESGLLPHRSHPEAELSPHGSSLDAGLSPHPSHLEARLLPSLGSHRSTHEEDFRHNDEGFLPFFDTGDFSVDNSFFLTQPDRKDADESDDDEPLPIDISSPLSRVEHELGDAASVRRTPKASAGSVSSSPSSVGGQSPRLALDDIASSAGRQSPTASVDVASKETAQSGSENNNAGVDGHSSDASSSPPRWACHKCTLENPHARKRCEACGSRRLPSEVPTSSIKQSPRRKRKGSSAGSPDSVQNDYAVTGHSGAASVDLSPEESVALDPKTKDSAVSRKNRAAPVPLSPTGRAVSEGMNNTAAVIPESPTGSEHGTAEETNPLDSQHNITLLDRSPASMSAHSSSRKEISSDSADETATSPARASNYMSFNVPNKSVHDAESNDASPVAQKSHLKLQGTNASLIEKRPTPFLPPIEPTRVDKQSHSPARDPDEVDLDDTTSVNSTPTPLGSATTGSTVKQQSLPHADDSDELGLADAAAEQSPAGSGQSSSTNKIPSDAADNTTSARAGNSVCSNLRSKSPDDTEARDASLQVGQSPRGKDVAKLKRVNALTARSVPRLRPSNSSKVDLSSRESDSVEVVLDDAATANSKPSAPLGPAAIQNAVNQQSVACANGPDQFDMGDAAEVLSALKALSPLVSKKKKFVVDEETRDVIELDLGEAASVPASKESKTLSSETREFALGRQTRSQKRNASMPLKKRTLLKFTEDVSANEQQALPSGLIAQLDVGGAASVSIASKEAPQVDTTDSQSKLDQQPQLRGNKKNESELGDASSETSMPKEGTALDPKNAPGAASPSTKQAARALESSSTSADIHEQPPSREKTVSPSGSIESSEDDEFSGSPVGLAYIEKRQWRIERNRRYLRGLNLESSIGQGPEEMSDDQSASNGMAQEDSEEDVPRRGMLFPTSFNKVGSYHAAGEHFRRQEFDDEHVAHDTGDPADRLYSRYPHRHSQIKMLLSLMGSSIRQSVRPLKRPSDRTSVFVPAPIFVTGPSGAGKTSIVRDVVKTLQQLHSKSADKGNHGHRSPMIASAYVNCATIEPSSINAVVESAYSQFMDSIHGSPVKPRKSRKRKQRSKIKKKLPTVLEHGAPAQLPLATAVTQHTTPMQEEDMFVETFEKVENEDDMEEKIERAMKRPRNTDTQATMKTGEPSTADATQRNFARKAKRRNTEDRDQAVSSDWDDSLDRAPRQVEERTAAHGAAVAFGRAILPHFGGSLKGVPPTNGQGCAFLVLDHAERLLSLSPKNTTSPEKNNFLAQLLLLPKVMGLNLTVVAVTCSNLLECSRVNNVAPVQKALGTIKDAVRPFRVHFAAYREKHMYKAILNQPHIRELIVGDNVPNINSAKSLQHKDSAKLQFQQRVYDSFIDTLIQSLSSSTRDVRDMIKLGRLWPSYIEPLHPVRIGATIHSVRSRLQRKSKEEDAHRDSTVHSDVCPPWSDTEALQREILALLDQNILPQIRLQLERGPFLLNDDFAAVQPEVARTSSSHDLPYLSKCLVLAAFICQNNKPDKDKQLFTIQKTGKKSRKRAGPTGEDAEGLAYGSTTWEQQQLKMIRPRSFPLERMLSVFVNVTGLIQGGPNLLLPEGCTDVKGLLRSMGSVCFFQSIAQLRDIGLLREVGRSSNRSDRNASLEPINMSSVKYWCGLTRNDAELMAESIDFPLSRFLI